MAKKVPLDEPSTVVGRILGLLLTEEKVDHAVQTLSRAVKESIPGTLGAGVSILDSRARRISAGFTDVFVERADTLLDELGQGPCLSAWASETAVLVQDVTTDPRWPDWSAAVSNLPIRSVISVPLMADGQSVGAMKIYAAFPAAYDEASVTLMQLFALPAATLLSHIQAAETPQRITETLQGALYNRDLVNRACGILMERHRLTPEEALQRLMRQARETQQHLRDVSAHLLAGSSADPD